MCWVVCMGDTGIVWVGENVGIVTSWEQFSLSYRALGVKLLTFGWGRSSVSSAQQGKEAGRVPEWTKGTDCKSVVRKPIVGSNPTAAS